MLKIYVENTHNIVRLLASLSRRCVSFVFGVFVDLFDKQIERCARRRAQKVRVTPRAQGGVRVELGGVGAKVP